MSAIAPPEAGRDWFSAAVECGGPSTILVPTVAGKRPYLTYCLVNTIQVAPGGTGNIVGSVSGVNLFDSVHDVIGNPQGYGPLFKGMPAALNDGLTFSKVAGGLVFVVVLGYYLAS